jgi:hypothetical protein
MIALVTDTGRRHAFTDLKLIDDQDCYTMEELLQLRRQMLRFARSLPPGPERNARRQIELSLRSLFKNKAWLAEHTVDG